MLVADTPVMDWNHDEWGEPSDYDVIDGMTVLGDLVLGAEVEMTEDVDEKIVYTGDIGTIVGFVDPASGSRFNRVLVAFEDLVEPIKLEGYQIEPL